MSNNKQAQEAGTRADEIIKNLANPSPAIETETSTVEVLDKVTPVQAPHESDGNWENRFKGYKATTDDTIHKLRQKVNQFDLLVNENEKIKADLEELKAHAPKAPDELLTNFSEEEVEGFSKLVNTKVGKLEDQVSRLTNELSRVHEKEEADKVDEARAYIRKAVKSAVPDYDTIDSDPNFGAWMKSLDGFGNLRMDLLSAAMVSNPPDISRIVQFYVEFGNQRKTPEQEAPHYTQQELLQTPSSLPGTKVEAPQGMGIQWTQDLIAQLYKDKATGKLSQEKFGELEQDYFNSLKVKR